MAKKKKKTLPRWLTFRTSYHLELPCDEVILKVEARNPRGDIEAKGISLVDGEIVFTLRADTIPGILELIPPGVRVRSAV